MVSCFALFLLTKALSNIIWYTLCYISSNIIWYTLCYISLKIGLWSLVFIVTFIKFSALLLLQNLMRQKSLDSYNKLYGEIHVLWYVSGNLKTSWKFMKMFTQE